MEDQIILKGRLEPKNNILSHPEMYKDVTVLCFVVSEPYKKPMIDYYNEKGIKDYQELTVTPWPATVTDRAKHLFFAIRDRIVIDQNGPQATRQDKDHLYRSCVEDLDLWHKGKKKNSIKDLDKRELHMATERMIEYAYEAEVDIRDLVPEMKAVRTELKQ